MIRLSPIAEFVRGLGEYYLLSEVAAALDVPDATVRGLKNRDPARWGPSHKTWYGDQLVYLYTPADLARLAGYFEELRRTAPARLTGSLGRPRMWTRGEVVDRQRRRAKVSYYRRRARQLRETDPQAARQANNRAQLLARTLHDEGRARRRELATRM